MKHRVGNSQGEQKNSKKITLILKTVTTNYLFIACTSYKLYLTNFVNIFTE